MAKESRGLTVSARPMTRLRAVAIGQVLALPTSPPVQRAALAPVAALLFLTGMCALIFQTAWFREFRLVFGASTAASSAVLAVFMTIPYFIVWAMPHTSGDLLLYLIFALGLAAFAILKALCGLLFASAPSAEPGLPHAAPSNGSEADRAEPLDDMAAAAGTFLLAYGAAACLTLISQAWLWFSECGAACTVSFAKTALVWSVIWPLSWIIFLARFF